MFQCELPIKATSMLIPKPAYQNRHWPVVACDQYTSEPEYWQKRAQDNGALPSTLNLILPEYILEEKGEKNCQDELRQIWNTMLRYQNEAVFQCLEPGFILCSRLLPDGKTQRNGVVLAIDLDDYLSVDRGEPAIRASESTVESRLPARIAVREQASLELPHVLLLIDDRKRAAVEGLAKSMQNTSSLLYDIELPDMAGRVRAHFVPEHSQAAANFINALKQLPSFVEQGIFAYVGDGNHSLAAAKRIREKAVQEGRAGADDPNRYALVELINIHDPGLIFHPIHQLIYDTSPAEALHFAQTIFKDEAVNVSESLDFNIAYTRFISAQMAHRGSHTLLLRRASRAHLLTIEKPADVLAISSAHRWTGGMHLQLGKRIDYIHGEHALANLSMEKHCAIYLPNLAKRDFFPALEKLSVFPKKTFSLGEAAEKRHYIEARAIR